MKQTVQVDGLKELDEALGQLKKSTAKGVLRRVGLKALSPVAAVAKNLAPVDEGALRESIGVGTKLTRRQAKLHKNAIRSGASDASFVEVFVGAGGLPQATLREFGGDGHPPDPYMRPAWEQNKHAVLETIKTDLWSEIQKTAQRAARRASRAAAKGR